MKYTFVLILLSFATAAQQTVGVFEYTDEAYEGYTFFSPMNNSDAYLVDNCGKLVHQWDGNNRPGLSGYLTDSGIMLRTNKVSSPFYSQASTGGNLQLVDWNDNTVWSHDFNQTEFIQHHDAKLLPNGNIIFIGWERISVEEQRELGRRESDLSSPYLWGEFIWEINPVGTSSYELIWAWHLKDHFVQDVYADKSTYGVVKENIGKVDINYQGPGAWGDDDWWHCNAIDYNSSLDQILLNSRNNNELWIIDHSTTTLEAASNSGGNSGRGGELIFRWGNPEAYNVGISSDLRMYGSHGHYWIPDGLPNAGKIMYFNNGDSRPQGYYSTVEMIDPTKTGWNYEKNALDRYLPIEPELVYVDPDNPIDFLSYFLSNAQQLPNGNVFINEGGNGRLFEINENKETVWEYVSPVRSSFIPQGSFPFSNDIFRAYKLGPDYSGFDGQVLVPGEIIEGENEYSLCLDVSIADQNLPKSFSFLNQNERIILKHDQTDNMEYRLMNSQGLTIASGTMEKETIIEIQKYTTGLYFLTVQYKGNLWTEKILKY